MAPRPSAACKAGKTFAGLVGQNVTLVVAMERASFWKRCGLCVWEVGGGEPAARLDNIKAMRAGPAPAN
jgi:hypothetical protein